jgi:hypothetical protein
MALKRRSPDTCAWLFDIITNLETQRAMVQNS